MIEMLIWKVDLINRSLIGLLLTKDRRLKTESSKLSTTMKLFCRGREYCREKELNRGNFKLSLIFLRQGLVKCHKFTLMLLPEIEM